MSAETTIKVPTEDLPQLLMLLKANKEQLAQLTRREEPAYDGLIAGVEEAIGDAATQEAVEVERELVLDAARKIYAREGTHEIRIDDDAEPSYADGATWVTAWVRVPD